MVTRGGGSQSYGFPIYCAAWLPLAHIIKPDPPAAEADADDPSSSTPSLPMAVLGGGGGEGRSGVPNKLVVAALATGEEAAPALSPDTVVEVNSEEEVPYRMAVHPRGDGVFCAFPNGCRLYRWESQEGEGPQRLALEPDQDALAELKDVGLQLAVSFSGEGSILAIGGEDGYLRVFNWPTMGSVLTEIDTKTSIKDLTISSDEKFLAVNRSSGPCRVWDLQSSEVVASLPRETGEIFGFCRFSNKADNSHVLFITVMEGDYGKIVSWNTTSWTRTGSKKITREAISAFAVSPNGALLAIGTIEGSIIVVGSKDMRTLVTVKKAHLGIVTTLTFSQDSRTLLSTSFDSSARVTSVGSPKSNGTSIWPMLLVVILAILVYYCTQHKEDILAMLQR
ncbi:sec12-like protein 2 [Zea mays]|uniref:SEC12-like protein 2 n=2 Tax=Zea mays TaxID=4577 RepID=B4FBA5_MAIZE|nr:sec12-like protein 2 [Zea mays]ACF79398.1 unknown [Zea mays]ACG39270.1 sec12-like protein 2 [Zea mays]ACL53129.1 unknown [Zea mays]ACL54133.1 unknown [Zea mays]ACN28559.1 unknown [Zea mays]|eukprot:NP_001130983.1 sec12-like protein 2 [Zea mays]